MLQNQGLRYDLEAHITSKMAMSKKNNSGSFGKEEVQERIIRPESSRLFRLSVVLLFLFVIFIWSSSSIIISGSIAHVCVLSRKLSDQYCLSVGADGANYGVPLSLINDSTNNVSVADQRRENSVQNTSSGARLSLINDSTDVSVVDQRTENSVGARLSLSNDSTNVSVVDQRTENSVSARLSLSNDSTNMSVVDQRTENSVHNTNSGVPLSLINDSTEMPVVDQRTENSVQNTNSGALSEINDSTNMSVVDQRTENSVHNSTNYGVPLSLINDSTNMSVVDQRMVNSVHNNTLNTLVLSSEEPSTRVDNNQVSPKEKSPILSPISNSISTTELMLPEVPESEFTKLVIREGVDKAKAEEEMYSRKGVEAQIAMLRTYVSKLKPSNCEGRGIYVYDLPPKFNTDLVAKCDEMMPWLGFCKYFTNDAMGEPIPDLGKGWYNTHQFSLEPIFHKRILKHSCRVEDPEDANIFYVPFYGALEMIRCHFTDIRCDAYNSSVVTKELLEWLEQQKMWKKNSGLDHVFVLGKITYDLRRDENAHWGTSLLELDELKNPLKLLIERHPWTLTEVGMPYPTYFHPISDEEIISWQTNVRRAKRRNLISFAGAMHSRWKNIRPILIEQCTSAPRACNFLNCSGETCVESTPVINLFAESEFCLQPPGDSPTRKSFFDSLIVGCIPVVFDPFTAHYQYPWHFPADYKKYSVYIDQEAVKMSEVNVIEQLVKIPLRERREMRKYIIDELMPRLIYANADAKLEKFEDAITIAVNNLHQMVISRLPN